MEAYRRRDKLEVTVTPQLIYVAMVLFTMYEKLSVEISLLKIINRYQ